MTFLIGFNNEHYTNGDYTQRAETAVGLDARNGLGWFSLGQYHSELNDLTRALECFSKAGMNSSL